MESRQKWMYWMDVIMLNHQYFWHYKNHARFSSCILRYIHRVPIFGSRLFDEADTKAIQAEKDLKVVAHLIGPHLARFLVFCLTCFSVLWATTWFGINPHPAPYWPHTLLNQNGGVINNNFNKCRELAHLVLICCCCCFLNIRWFDYFLFANCCKPTG